jgi:putative membrane protein
VLTPWLGLLVVAAAGKGWLDHRAVGWRLDGDRMLLRFRRLARRTVVVSRRRAQRHELRETLLQRRAGLAGFSVAAGAGTRAGIRHLDRADARGLFDALR